MRPFAITILALLTWLVGPAAGGADDESAGGRLASHLLDVLELAPADCPAGALPGQGRVARCGLFEGDFGDWKADWEVALRRFDLPERPASEGPWSTGSGSEGIYRRSYSLGEDEFEVRFEEKAGLVMFSFAWEGADGAGERAGESAAVRLAGFAGVGMPEPLQRPEPAYPAAAEGSGMTGRVALEVVVDETGRVGEIEVLREEPRRKGFADHAVAAVKRWRYRPVEVNGRAVPVRLTVYVTMPAPEFRD